MEKKNHIEEAALDYLAGGFSVIPIKPDKKPFVKWEEYQKRRPTAEEIRGWWEKWPQANVGIITGAISQVCVIDIDEEQGREEIGKYIPDSILIPTVKTPSGFEHLYFSNPSPSIGNNTRIIPGCDFRGEGGYVVGPPSMNGTGKGYEWMPSLSIFEIAPPVLPSSYINAVKNNDALNKNKINAYRGGVVTAENPDHNRLQVTTSDHKLFHEGRRDNDVFSVVLAMLQKGHAKEVVLEISEFLCKNCIPPLPQAVAREKVESAFKRMERFSGSITQEVRDFVVTTSDLFLTTDVYNRLQVTTRAEKKAIVMALLRLHKEGILERGRGRDGMFRRIENQVEPVDFLNAPTDEFPIAWPMGVHQFSVIYPGNIIIIAGSKGAGKTAFLLNLVRLNQDRDEMIYLNSEMGDTEFRKRLELFEGMPLSSWNVKAYHRNSNFADLITGEKKVFIVDFLEVTTDFWKVAQYIKEIHQKLKDGIAIIALQKSEGKEHGRGGDFSKEKARLYLALDYLPDRKMNRIRIVDAKAWRTAANPRGMERHYKLVNGSKFIPQDEWKE